jgi:hypothetical protein
MRSAFDVVGAFAMKDWLNTLTEDYLLAWSNRGQLRRAQKLLSQLADGSVTLREDAGHGAIDGHQQHLEGVGFEGLTCSCTATGTCHHLVCFLLALSEQARVTATPTDASPAPNTSAANVAEASVAQSNVAQSNVSGTEATPHATPFWRDPDMDALTTTLGRAHIRRAHRLHAQGVGVDWQETDVELIATVELGDGASVRIPSAGLRASVCSCKQATCVHRALTILVYRDAHGLASFDAPGTLGGHGALDAYQREIVNAALAWLGEVAGHGLSGFSATQFARGRALATELQQADLPRPGRSLSVWLAQIEERDSAGSASALDLASLAGLWMLLRGLGAAPLPRPFAELAGSHRRNYRLRPHQSLLCLGPEIWRTPTGFRGYSMHFLAMHSSADQQLESERTTYCSFSEARGPRQDPTWNHANALHQASLAGHKLTTLPGRSFVLHHGAFSEDGRIAARSQTTIDKLSAVQSGQLLQRAEGAQATCDAMIRSAQTNPAGGVPGGKALLRCRLDEPPQYDPYRKQWMALGTCVDDESVTIQCRDTHQANLLAQHRTSLLALFGYTTLDDSGLSLTPIIGVMDEASLLVLAGPDSPYND